MQIIKHSHNTWEPTVHPRDAESQPVAFIFGPYLLLGFGFGLGLRKTEPQMPTSTAFQLF